MLVVVVELVKSVEGGQIKMEKIWRKTEINGEKMEKKWRKIIIYKVIFLLFIIYNGYT